MTIYKMVQFSHNLLNFWTGGWTGIEQKIFGPRIFLTAKHSGPNGVDRLSLLFSVCPGFLSRYRFVQVSQFWDSFANHSANEKNWSTRKTFGPYLDNGKPFLGQIRCFVISGKPQFFYPMGLDLKHAICSWFGVGAICEGATRSITVSEAVLEAMAAMRVMQGWSLKDQENWLKVTCIYDFYEKVRVTCVCGRVVSSFLNINESVSPLLMIYNVKE